MNADQIRLAARFDQINAAHREAMAAARRAREALLAMEYDDSQRALDEMPPIYHKLLIALVEEDHDSDLAVILGRRGR